MACGTGLPILALASSARHWWKTRPQLLTREAALTAEPRRPLRRGCTRTC
jgi:hypothetical protein